MIAVKRTRILNIENNYRTVKFIKFPIAAGIGPERPFPLQWIAVTLLAESQVTPAIEQQAVALVDDTWVDFFFISCHDRTTQQQSGDDLVQLAWGVAWDSTPTINAERANAKIEFLRDEEIIV